MLVEMYADLSWRTKRSKQAQLFRAAVELAGSDSDARLLISDVAGTENETMAELLESFEKVDDKSFMRQAIRSTSPSFRGWLSAASSQKRELPFGQAFFDNAKKSKLLRSTENEKRGRKPVELPTFDSLVSLDSKGCSTTHKSRALVLRELKRGGAEIGSSTFYRKLKAEKICTFGRRGFDICDYCERLRLIRVRSQESAPPQWQNSSHRHIKSLGLVVAPGSEIEKALYPLLLWHEQLATKIQAFYVRSARDADVVLTHDFSGPITICKARGTSKEFYEPLYYECFCAHVQLGRGGSSKTLLLFSKKNSAFQKKTGRVAFAFCEQTLRSLQLDLSSSDRVILWSDTARYYRSKCFIGSSIVDAGSSVLSSAGSVQTAFFCEKHGKSICDTVFHTVKSLARSVTSLDELRLELEAIQYVVLTFESELLRDPDLFWTGSPFKNIACKHLFAREKKLFKEDGETVAIKLVKSVADDSSSDEDNAPDVNEADSVEDAAVVKRLEKKQKCSSIFDHLDNLV